MQPFLLLAWLAFASAHAAADEPRWHGNWHDLPELVGILETVPEGATMLENARKKSPNFLSLIKKGSASFTESTFSRTYSLLDGKEQITLHHEVTLNESLPLSDAVVDLAHELVHFTEKGMLDPYKPGFDLSQFIRNGIEGQGGELSALAVECRVAWSLEKVYRRFPQHRLCETYRLKGNAFDRVGAQRDYYALGNWFAKASGELRRAIPEVTTRPVIFTSSYASKPYPLALAEEYQMTRKAACANNKRKYHLIASQSEQGGRVPASTALWKERERLKEYEHRYCGE